MRKQRNLIAISAACGYSFEQMTDWDTLLRMNPEDLAKQMVSAIASANPAGKVTDEPKDDVMGADDTAWTLTTHNSQGVGTVGAIPAKGWKFQFFSEAQAGTHTVTRTISRVCNSVTQQFIVTLGGSG